MILGYCNAPLMQIKSPFSDQAKKRLKQEKDRVFKVIETKDDNADISLS